MKLNAFLVLLVGVMVMGCVCEEEPGTKIPVCIKQKIRTLESEPVRSPAASITMIITTDRTYFYIPPYCCDFYGELFDDQCNLVCNPDGGITGNGDGDCPEFTIVEEKVIWEDER